MGENPAKVYLRRFCAEHGETAHCISSDARFYWVSAGRPENAVPGGGGRPDSDGPVSCPARGTDLRRMRERALCITHIFCAPSGSSDWFFLGDREIAFRRDVSGRASPTRPPEIFGSFAGLRAGRAAKRRACQVNNACKAAGSDPRVSSGCRVGSTRIRFGVASASRSNYAPVGNGGTNAAGSKISPRAVSCLNCKPGARRGCRLCRRSTASASRGRR